MFPQIDTIIANFLPKITLFQENFVASHGVYFQGLKSNSFVPDSATPVTQDMLSTTPQGKVGTWLDTKLASVQIPFSLEMNEYQAPQGRGWQLFIRTKSGVDTYVRSIGYGCEEASRTFGWTLVVDKPAK